MYLIYKMKLGVLPSDMCMKDMQCMKTEEEAMSDVLVELQNVECNVPYKISYVG